MAFSSHFRGLSPGGGRHHMAGPRASTGMVQLGSSVDPYEAPRSRYDYDEQYYPSDVGYTSIYRHHPRHRSTIDVQPLVTQTYRDPGHSTKKRTEYAIQPQSRHRSNTASAADIYDNSARLAVPSSPSSYLRPVVNPGRGRRSPSPLPIEPSRHTIPVSSSRHTAGHRRVFSTDYASDTGRLEMRDSARHRSGVHHGAHRVQPPTGRRRHPPYDGPKKDYNIDNYDAYSYTGPGEEARRDLSGDYLLVRPRHPKGRTSLDRPMSVNLAEASPQWLARSKDLRHHGPPPTSRGLDKLDREGRPRSSARGFDEYRDTSRTRAPAGHDRALVPLPHESDDDYYSDVHRRSRRKEPRRHDDRSPRPHNGGSGALALAGLGTAALASGYSDASEYENHRPGRRRHRRREAEREYDSAQASTRDLAESGPSNSERSKQLYLEPADAINRRRHSRRHTSRRSGSDTEVYTDDEDLHKYRREPAAAPHRCRHSSTDTSSAEDHSGKRPPRDRSRHRSRSRRAPEDGRPTESRSSTSIEHGEEVRKPITVEPPVLKEPAQPAPKGILKPPKKAFPEEPNPIREGVAPLKDANKNGIPPTARWTKIDRRLVNPAALEAGNERYEERPEFVIVLRVLTKEEIQAYALKTQEIRDARHEEYVRERRQRREEDQRHGRRGQESSSDDEDESEDEPLKIEAPPVPNANTSLPIRSRPASQSPPLPARPSAAQV